LVALFNDFKLKKIPGCNFLTFKIEKKTKIVLHEQGEGDEGYEEFLTKLPDAEGRYCVVDVQFETSDGRTTSKLVFISWVPDDMKPFTKMLYAGSKEAMKSVFTGVGVHLQCSDYADLDYESVILPAVLKFS